MTRPVRAPTQPVESTFRFAGERLAAHWKVLHAGDLEPWPDAQRSRLLQNLPGAEAGDPARLVVALQDAWRAYHEGDFAGAHARGLMLGLAGAGVALRAACAEARYRGVDASARHAQLAALLPVAEALRNALPEEPNSHFRLAQVLGDLLENQDAQVRPDEAVLQSQHAALRHALRLAPRHGEAQLALGVFHAHAIARLGAIGARMSCAASATAAEHHLELARRLLPSHPRVWLETGHALQLLSGIRQGSAVTEAFRRAAKMTPRDAASALDADWARAQLR